MGILTLDHEGWELDIEYWRVGNNFAHPKGYVDWKIDRVAQAGHPNDYPYDYVIREAIMEEE
jgi:hypothetical protein